ncbi:MAG: hypothetical protein IH831_10510, partial [Planctomycetes bacterium]|nr:hypothetical protein [Planctomycetota bacterium]
MWAKKIRGKVHYFGPWSDPNGALDRFLAERDFLLAGRTPPPEQHTVANLLDQFLGEKQSNLDSGDITQTTFNEYEATCEAIHAYFGKHRALDGLTLNDFTGLRKALAKGKIKNTLSPVTLKRRLTVARMIFAEQPAAFKKVLKSPTQRTLRAARREKGEQHYTAAQIRKLVKTAEPELRAMILLGINCGFGPKDCFTLPAIAVERGWHTYARPKTEVERRCPLWPETAKAIKAVACKPLVFNGRMWDRWIVDREFKKACKQAGVESTGFYSLRRTFETIATTADVPQAIIDSIMGH